MKNFSHRSFPRYGLSSLLIFAFVSSTALSASDYTLVWSDEFDYSGLPDAAHWNYDVGGGGWGNNELQYYTEARLENARVNGGNLIIEAREEDFGGRSYTSARLLTKDKLDWTYGRFEARIQVPAGVGLWPAFWMLGTDITTVGWPACGEIDIMEFVGREPKEILGTIHGSGYSGGNGFTGSYTFAEDVSDHFHNFAIEWEPEVIRWYVDDILFHTATPEDIVGSGRVPNEWAFDHPQFIIMNVAIGGNLGGDVSPDLEFPVQMLVDYVRVYQQIDYGMFSEFPKTGEWIDTGSFLGMAYLAYYPWVYLAVPDTWVYASSSGSQGGWLYWLR